MLINKIKGLFKKEKKEQPVKITKDNYQQVIEQQKKEEREKYKEKLKKEDEKATSKNRIMKGLKIFGVIFILGYGYYYLENNNLLSFDTKEAENKTKQVSSTPKKQPTLNKKTLQESTTSPTNQANITNTSIPKNTPITKENNVQEKKATNNIPPKKETEKPKIDFIGFSYNSENYLVTFKYNNITSTKQIGDIIQNKYKILNVDTNTLELLNLETKESYFYNKI